MIRDEFNLTATFRVIGTEQADGTGPYMVTELVLLNDGVTAMPESQATAELLEKHGLVFTNNPNIISEEDYRRRNRVTVGIEATIIRNEAP